MQALPRNRRRNGVIEAMESKVCCNDCSHPRDCAAAQGESYDVSKQIVDVSLPINLSAIAALGCIDAKCCDEPTLVCKSSDGKNTSEIVITQRIELAIPVQFGVNIHVGDSEIDCIND